MYLRQCVLKELSVNNTCIRIKTLSVIYIFHHA